MQKMRDYIARQIKQKKLDGHASGSIAINEVRNFLCSFLSNQEQQHITTLINGYIKFSTLFVQTDHQELKIQLHLQQKKILECIQKRFATSGIYKTITTIKIQRPPAQYQEN